MRLAYQHGLDDAAALEAAVREGVTVKDVLDRFATDATIDTVDGALYEIRKAKVATGK